MTNIRSNRKDKISDRILTILTVPKTVSVLSMQLGATPNRVREALNRMKKTGLVNHNGKKESECFGGGHSEVIWKKL